MKTRANTKARKIVLFMDYVFGHHLALGANTAKIIVNVREKINFQCPIS